MFVLSKLFITRCSGDAGFGIETGNLSLNLVKSSNIIPFFINIPVLKNIPKTSSDIGALLYLVSIIAIKILCESLLFSNVQQKNFHKPQIQIFCKNFSTKKANLLPWHCIVKMPRPSLRIPNLGTKLNASQLSRIRVFHPLRFRFATDLGRICKLLASFSF